MTDIILNKKESIERCIRQVRTFYTMEIGSPFWQDYMRQDAVSMNLQRACEQCIDLANHIIKARKLGLPKESKESFSLLAQAGIIPTDLAARLENMVGQRSVIVHDCRALDVERLIDVVENHLDDLRDCTDIIVKKFGKG
ncbi:MAG: DUF86 domain-containing protein [Nitrospirae bacterium]|nr:DUF86 domain-containing protein [Nitrospirota bacterium]